MSRLGSCSRRPPLHLFVLPDAWRGGPVGSAGYGVSNLMSAFGGKADMTKRKYPLLQLQLGVKRTCLVAPHMSAYDPKRTCPPASARLRYRALC
jgi:hypothetical protein